MVVLKAAFLPIAVFVDAAAFLIDESMYLREAILFSPGTRAVGQFEMAYTIPVFSVLHIISWWKVFCAYLLLSVLYLGVAISLRDS